MLPCSEFAPVAGAFVKMINEEKRLTFMVISQDQGRYSMRNLPAGKYTVQGIGGEHQSKMSAAVDVAAGRATTVDVSLTDTRAPRLPAAWPFREPGGGAARRKAAARSICPMARAGRSS